MGYVEHNMYFVKLERGLLEKAIPPSLKTRRGYVEHNMYFVKLERVLLEKAIPPSTQNNVTIGKALVVKL